MGESLLSLELSEVRGGLSGVIDYNKDVFRASTARRIAAHLEECRRCGLQAQTFRAITQALRGSGNVDELALHRLRAFSRSLTASEGNSGDDRP